MCETMKRVPNFSSLEIELLTTLVKRYANVLENKKTNVVNNQLKDQTWEKLAKDFNSSSSICVRSSKSLRAKYENLKKTLKRKYSSHRRSLYGTGGGPGSSQDLNLTQEEEIIMELAGPSVEGLPPRFDCDEIPESKEAVIVKVFENTENSIHLEKENILPADNFNVNVLTEINTNPTTYEVNEESKTPDRFILKKKKATPLLRRNPESFNSTMEKYSELSRKKMDIVNAQLKSIEQKQSQDRVEHELKCAQLINKEKQDAKEHELRCELLRLDILLKKKALDQ